MLVQSIQLIDVYFIYLQKQASISLNMLVV